MFVVEEFGHDCFQLFDRVVKIGFSLYNMNQMKIYTYIYTFSKERQEVVDPRCFHLCLNSSDSNGLLIDHFHDLPFVSVFTWSSKFRTTETAVITV